MSKNLEKDARRRARRGELEHVVVSVLATAGIVTFAMMAPNAVRILKYVNPNWLERPDAERKLREVAYRLRRKGKVRFVKKDGHMSLELTKAGRAVLERAYAWNATLPKKARWDEKWRIVAFDIPERNRRVRDRVRKLMRLWGFYRLQDSLWVYPYDCEEVITMLKLDLKLGTGLRYIIGSAIEYDDPLRTYFKLK